jgi:hypothetical protein
MQAIKNMILHETFYNKLPQSKVFIEYCDQARRHRLTNESLIAHEIENNERLVLIGGVIDYFSILPDEHLFKIITTESRGYSNEIIEKAFNRVKDRNIRIWDTWKSALEQEHKIERRGLVIEGTKTKTKTNQSQDNIKKMIKQISNKFKITLTQ